MNKALDDTHFTTIHFYKGFEYKKVLFGFKDKILYRLPYYKNNRFYALKIIELKNKQFRLCRDKVGINKVKTLITNIDHQVKIINKHHDLPF